MPVLGTTIFIIAGLATLFAVGDHSFSKQNAADQIGQDVVTIGLWVMGLIAFYGRLILNRLEVLTEGATSYEDMIRRKAEARKEFEAFTAEQPAE
jgi:hypothetical protein